MSATQQNNSNQIAINHGNYLEKLHNEIHQYYDEKFRTRDANFNPHTFLQTDPKFLEIIEQTIQEIETFLETFHEYRYQKTPASFTSNFKFTQSFSRILSMIKNYAPQHTSSFQNIIYQAHIKLLDNPSIDFSEKIPNLWNTEPYHPYADISEMNLLAWWIFNQIPIDLVGKLLKKEPSLVFCVLDSHVSNYSKTTAKEFYRLLYQPQPQLDDVIVSYNANMYDFIENRSFFGLFLNEDSTKQYKELFAEYGLVEECKEDEIIQKIHSVFC
jgi:hypothetical protein